jgi:hypothetical protein
VEGVDFLRSIRNPEIATKRVTAAMIIAMRATQNVRDIRSRDSLAAVV